MFEKYWRTIEIEYFSREYNVHLNGRSETAVISAYIVNYGDKLLSSDMRSANFATEQGLIDFLTKTPHARRSYENLSQTRISRLEQKLREVTTK